jgi:hypothetical protein
MSTLRTINVIHPSGSTTNIVNDNAGNVAVGGTLTASTITSATSTALTIQSAGTTAMTVDTSQNVGIGTTSPSSMLDMAKSSASVVDLKQRNSLNTTILYTNSDGASILSSVNAYPMLFATSATERMRIDSSGNLLVGTTSVNYAGSGLTLSKDSGTTNWLVGPITGASTNFYVTAATSLGVYLAGTSATSWSSASDERLKDIIEPIADGLKKVNTLRAVIGSYKADKAKTRRPFLIAQDLQNVLPEAVDGSNPDALGVQYTEVIPLLVAAIKELSAKNDALEASNAAFEARLAALENK